MAKADKIYDIAEKLGYEGDTDGSTADAINAVSDALGFDGPHKGRITSALADLYTVVEGGGGGVDLGPLQTCPLFVDAAPVVGNTASIDDGLSFEHFKVGDTVVINYLSGNVGKIAAGATAVAFLTTEAGLQVDAYVCTVEVDGDYNLVYTTVSPWTGTVTEGQDEDGVTPWSLVIPELQNDASLFLYPHV